MVANMIAIRGHFRARARARITGTVQLHSEVGRALNQHNSTAGCFRLRVPFHCARARRCKTDTNHNQPLKFPKSHFGYSIINHFW